MSGLAVVGIAGTATAQSPPAGPLPPLQVEAPTAKKKPGPAPKAVKAATPAAPPSPPAGPTPNPKGDIGYLATKGTTATKIDTPLRNVPQSVSVITEQQIKDQSFQSIGDISRYVPGVILHQGEGNRD